MAEQHLGVWRVVAHDGQGCWSVHGEPYTEKRLAEEEAARLVQGKQARCSNAGVYPEAGGVVQTPRWMKLRQEQGGQT